MFTITTNKINFLLLNISIILLFAIIYKKYGNINHFYFSNKIKQMDITDALYFSASTYTTIGNSDIYPKSKFMKKIILFQILFLLCSLIIISYTH